MNFETRPAHKNRRDTSHHLYREFDTYEEFLAHVTAPTKESPLAKTSHEHGSDWSGTKDFAEAIDLAKNGWPEGSKQIKAMTDAIVSRVTMMVKEPEIVYGLTPGLSIDMGRFLEGEPECFMDMVESETIREGRGRVVKLVYDTCSSAGITVNAMFLRGAAMVALADAFEKAGISCEIIVTAFNLGKSWAERGRVSSEYRVRVKRAEANVNIDMLAFAVANSAHFRRFIFSAYEHESREDQSGMGIGAGYGRVDPDGGYEGEIDKGDIFITGAEFGAKQWESEEGTIKWCLDRLREQGVVLEGGA